MRVPTDLWIKALLRRSASGGASAVVARRGDAEAGVTLIKVRLLDGTAKLFGPAMAGRIREDGLPRLEPMTAKEVVPEAEADAIIQRQASFDPDIWVVEIDDRQGRNFIDE